MNYHIKKLSEHNPSLLQQLRQYCYGINGSEHYYLDAETETMYMF